MEWKGLKIRFSLCMYVYFCRSILPTKVLLWSRTACRQIESHKTIWRENSKQIFHISMSEFSRVAIEFSHSKNLWSLVERRWTRFNSACWACVCLFRLLHFTKSICTNVHPAIKMGLTWADLLFYFYCALQQSKGCDNKGAFQERSVLAKENSSKGAFRKNIGAFQQRNISAKGRFSDGAFWWRSVIAKERFSKVAF